MAKCLANCCYELYSNAVYPSAPVTDSCAVSDVSVGDRTVMFETSGAPAVMLGVTAVTSNFYFLGRTWQLVVSPSHALASRTAAALFSRSLGLGAPVTFFAAFCSVLIAISVRRSRREAHAWRSFEEYVRLRAKRGCCVYQRGKLFTHSPSVMQVGYVLHELR